MSLLNLMGNSVRRPLAAGALLVALATTTPALALQCPTPQAGGPGVLGESAQSIARVSSMLAAGDLDNRIPTILDELRRRHPGAGAAELTNYMVTAYCPVVAARTDLDQAGQQAALDTFATQVASLASRR